VLPRSGNATLVSRMDEWTAVEKLSVPASAIGASIARAGIRPALNDMSKPEQEIVELLAASLVTNAVRHSGMSEPDVVEVAVYRNDARAVRIEVTDIGPGFAPASVSHRGFGLQVLDLLASRWGVDHELGRTTVWFELRR
jgi:anti-sigma regulatory factor (Ser/Thr protein kinase)